MQMPPTFGQPPMPLIQPRFGHVALDDRSPAPELHEALGGSVLDREVALLVVARSIASLVDRRAEEPGGTQRLVERDHGVVAGHLVEQVEDRLGEVVGVHRATGHVHDRKSGLRSPVPAEVVGDPHRPGGIAGHGMDAAVGRARADREDRRRLRGEPVEPLARGDRLAGGGIVAEPAPVALFLECLVRDRPLDHQHERLELTPVGLEPPFDERVGAFDRTALVVDQRPVDRNLRRDRGGRRARSPRCSVGSPR